MLRFTPPGAGESIPFLRAVGSCAESTARRHAEKSLNRCRPESQSAYVLTLIIAAPSSYHSNREKEEP